MLKYRDNHKNIDIWSTTVDSLCITVETEGVFDAYAKDGLTWKEAMADYVGKLTALMCEKFYREDKLEVEITASRLAYRVIEEKRFNKKYSPENSIYELLSDYENGTKKNEGADVWYWEDVNRKYAKY
ncbi:MAG: hypothetical protein IJE51_01115 [Clostridia bacterium]|nr:hypothetical protein [Clostridia bacterium]